MWKYFSSYGVVVLWECLFLFIFIVIFFFKWISSFFLNNYILGRMYILSFFSSIVTSVLTKQHVLHRWIREFYPSSCWSFLLSMRSSTQSWYNILTVIKRNMWRYNILSLQIPLWAAAEAEFLFKLDYCSFYNYVFSHKKRRTYLFTEVNVPSGNSN